jgi:alpha-mannosidase
LVPVAATGPKDGLLPESASFGRLDTPNVMLLTMKQAEDGGGLILRLAEMEGQDTAATVTPPHFEILKAFGTNRVEENQGELKHDRHTVLVTLKANEIATVRCANR